MSKTEGLRMEGQMYSKRIVYSNKWDGVLFVERSGELRWLARLSTEGTEPKGDRVLRGRISQSV